MADLDDKLRKIQALIDKGHGTDNEAEARAFLAKADSMMVQYSIEATQLLDPDRNIRRTATAEEPELRTITVFQGYDQDGDMDRHMRWALDRVFHSVCEHLFIRKAPFDRHSMVSGQHRVVGYPVDLRFAEMFFLKIKLHMFSEMLTTIDPSKPWEECVVGLKNMGHRWIDVHHKMASSNHPEYPYPNQPWERRIGVKFTSVMKKYVEQHGIPRNTSSNPDAWRADYVDGYVGMIQRRLREMREATVEENPLLPDLIGDKKSNVQEALWDLFPDLRPHPDSCQCDNCHYAKCKDRQCQRSRCKAMRAPVRAGRIRYRRYNADAAAAGRAAGARADLTDKGAIG